jgi:hypothetical protein
MEIRVDIDLTICDTPIDEAGMPDYRASKPFPERISRINHLYEEGHIIIYWTSRGSRTGIDWRELTERQLREWGCRYHELHLDKPYYDVLYDDKAQQLL